MPRLLMLVHAHLPDGRVAAEARAARAAGFEVDIVGLRRPGESAEGIEHGVPVLRLPVRRRRGAGMAALAGEYLGFTVLATLAAARLMRRRRYSVVHVHNPPDFLVVAALIPRAFGARVVLDFHDLASDMFAMRFDGRPGATVVDRILRLVERTAAGLADAVVTVHDPYRDELVRRGVDPAKIVVVMNSLDETLLPPPLAEDEPRDEFRVVYHGTVTPHYGIELIVEAAAEARGAVPGLRVDVYGEGDAVPGLRARAHELGLDDIVRIEGVARAQVDVLRAVQSAAVGVIPNLPSRLNRFALSTKLFEYVALGVPVVSADLPTIADHFSRDEVRFFRAGDARSLARALVDVANDPGAAAARARAARQRYENYRWERSARAYTTVLASLTRDGRT
jgi:glycosyltransferase involved in cell wall biosynthesis